MVPGEILKSVLCCVPDWRTANILWSLCLAEMCLAEKLSR